MSRPSGPVHVVGAGLVGTSIGLGLTAAGGDVVVHDASPTVAALAADLGAGRLAREHEEEPGLVVVAAPPDVTARLVVEALRRHPGAVVTDVASTKAGIVAAVLAEVGAAGTARYVGGHPMAGRERHGPMAARGDLFVGRPWVLTPLPGTAAHATAAVRDLASGLGAGLVELDPAAHDEAVALVSHLPQVAASLVAARLVGAPERAVALAGQGLRDVTRIAASDPVLWAQILTGNAGPLVHHLRALRDDLDAAVAALEAGSLGGVARLVADGNAGHAVVPGKHGTAPAAYASVPVLVPDRPASLAALIGAIGEIGVNVEDLRIEHSPGRAVGVVEVAVLPAAREGLVTALRGRGWSVPD